MGMGVFQQKEPGAHKIGAAISGPRITGGNFMDTRIFSDKKHTPKKHPLDQSRPRI